MVRVVPLLPLMWYRQLSYIINYQLLIQTIDLSIVLLLICIIDETVLILLVVVSIVINYHCMLPVLLSTIIIMAFILYMSILLLYVVSIACTIPLHDLVPPLQPSQHIPLTLSQYLPPLHPISPNNIIYPILCPTYSVIDAIEACAFYNVSIPVAVLYLCLQVWVSSAIAMLVIPYNCYIDDVPVWLSILGKYYVILVLQAEVDSLLYYWIFTHIYYLLTFAI